MSSWLGRRSLRACVRPISVAMIVASLAACSRAPADLPTTTPGAESTPTTAAALPGQPLGPRLEGGRLVASARAIPTYSVDLSFESAGVVKEVLVDNGSEVHTGDVLARLDSAQAELVLADAEAALRQAQADYNKVVAKATPAQIQRAQIQIRRARADLAVTQAQVSQKDLDAAQANLANAKARLDEMLQGPKKDTVDRARAGLDGAKADLAATRSRLAADKVNAEADILLAANDLRNKQDFYSRIYWRNRGIEREGTLTQEQIDQEAAARRDVDDANDLVEKRKIAYEDLKQQEIDQIAARTADVQAAEASLRLTMGSVTEADIAYARNQYADALARIERATGQFRQGTLDSAQTDVDLAEANLQSLMSDPLSEDVAVAEAKVARAEVTVKRAKLEISQLSLTAPHDGRIEDLRIAVGQAVEARKSVLVLADLSSWKLETEDLSELNVVSIREGDPVKINFFALPDMTLTGKVSRIDAYGVNDKTVGVTYVATIIPDSWDPQLRWNMTATVEIGAMEPTP